MSDVEFNEEPSITKTHPEKVSLFTKLALATGLVHTPRGAQVLLLLTGALALAVAAFFFFASSSELPETNPSNYDIWPS